MMVRAYITASPWHHCVLLLVKRGLLGHLVTQETLGNFGFSGQKYLQFKLSKLLHKDLWGKKKMNNLVI